MTFCNSKVQLITTTNTQAKWLALLSPFFSSMFFTTVSMETSLSRHASNADIKSVEVARAERRGEREISPNLFSLKGIVR